MKLPQRTNIAMIGAKFICPTCRTRLNLRPDEWVSLAYLSSGKSSFLLKTDLNNIFQSITTNLHTKSCTVATKRRINFMHKHSCIIYILESKLRHTGNSHAIAHNSVRSPGWTRQGAFDCQHSKSLPRSRSEFSLSYLKFEVWGVQFRKVYFQTILSSKRCILICYYNC